MSTGFRYKLEGFISLDKYDQNEEIFFKANSFRYIKPIVRMARAGLVSEKISYHKPETREGDAIFVEDFEKFILPELNRYLKDKFNKIEEAENNFIGKVQELLKNSPKFREVVEDTIRNEKFRGEHL